jgi:hypothetical protein
MEKDPLSVWIELRQPENDEQAEEMVELVNRMLARLIEPGEAMGSKFFWMPDKRMFCYGGDYGFRYLTDRGEWFNLRYLGREHSAPAIVQNTWESLNGVLYDLTKGDPASAIETVEDLISDLEKAGANPEPIES